MGSPVVWLEESSTNRLYLERFPQNVKPRNNATGTFWTAIVSAQVLEPSTQCGFVVRVGIRGTFNPGRLALWKLVLCFLHVLVRRAFDSVALHADDRVIFFQDPQPEEINFAEHEGVIGQWDHPHLGPTLPLIVQ